MANATYDFGSFSLDLAEHRLLRDGQPVPITPRVFAVLTLLVENAGHLIEKERLLNEVWHDAIVEEANLNRAISVLRKTLGESPTERYIETVPKRGYRFVAPVHSLPHDPHVMGASGHRVPQTPVARIAPIPLALASALVVLSGVLGYLAWNRSYGTSTAARFGASVHRQVTFTGRETVPALSPDGKSIAYVSGEFPQRKVIVQDIDAGHAVTVFEAPEAGALRWSRDNAELVFWARGNGLDGLYLGSRKGRARKIGAAGAFVTSWSPDGSTIAVALFVPQKIRFIDRLGTHQRTIALKGSRDWIWDLDWSPIDDRILFVAMDDSGRASIWSIRSDGTDQVKLLSAGGEIFAARWAPGGDGIYYFARSDQTVSLFKALIPRRGSPAEPLPAPLVSGLEADGSFGISADASRLVYARAPYYSNLWLVESREGTTRPVRAIQLTHGTSLVERPRVSPDGRWIAFNMGYEWRTNLFVMPSTGGAPRQLTFFNAFTVAAAWDPDGRAVAFASTEGGEPRLWIVNADGSDARPLAAAEISANYILSWAPGTRLLYQRSDYRDFYALDPATGRSELLVKNHSNGFISSADYSPDGRQLALTWTGRQRGGLWRVDEDGQGETLIHHLTDQSAFNPVAMGWSPDATAVIAFDGRRAVARGPSVVFGETMTAAKVIRVPLGGGRPTTLVDLPFDEIGGVTMFPDARRFVVSVYSSRSDVWVVDAFDGTHPHAAAGR